MAAFRWESVDVHARVQCGAPGCPRADARRRKLKIVEPEECRLAGCGRELDLCDAHAAIVNDWIREDGREHRCRSRCPHDWQRGISLCYVGEPQHYTCRTCGAQKTYRPQPHPVYEWR